MRDYIPIGAAPPDEECAQVGSHDYAARARDECRRYIELLRETMGPEPEGASLRIKWFNHDFGTYCEVVCVYDVENEGATDYAYACERDGPVTWDDRRSRLTSQTPQEEMP